MTCGLRFSSKSCHVALSNVQSEELRYSVWRLKDVAIIYSTSCRSKLVWLSFFHGTEGFAGRSFPCRYIEWRLNIASIKQNTKSTWKSIRLPWSHMIVCGRNALKLKLFFDNNSVRTSNGEISKKSRIIQELKFMNKLLSWSFSGLNWLTKEIWMIGSRLRQLLFLLTTFMIIYDNTSLFKVQCKSLEDHYTCSLNSFILMNS